ncbi:MAG: MGMT family protein [Candidatus Aenigmatarchaeota archaeon]|nr:MAG: MGMT family protein [Candidatus Aenigmarchaeota archaeon]
MKSPKTSGAEMSREKVYAFLKQVPKDRVTTYKELAGAAGTHPRAVAVYMKTNEDPVNIPCFRVISSDGSLGGYSGKDGIKGKLRLLERHGIEVVKGRVPEKYVHRF